MVYNGERFGHYTNTKTVCACWLHISYQIMAHHIIAELSYVIMMRWCSEVHFNGLENVKDKRHNNTATENRQNILPLYCPRSCIINASCARFFSPTQCVCVCIFRSNSAAAAAITLDSQQISCYYSIGTHYNRIWTVRTLNMPLWPYFLINEALSLNVTRRGTSPVNERI